MEAQYKTPPLRSFPEAWEEFKDICNLFFLVKAKSEEDFSKIDQQLNLFLEQCPLSLSEMQIAFEKCAKRELMIDNKPIELFREISYLKLIEIQTAYIQFRNTDFEYKKHSEELFKYKLSLLEEKPKPLSEDYISEQIQILTQFVNEENFVPVKYHYLYNELVKRKIIRPLNEEEKELLREQTVSYIRKRYSKDKDTEAIVKSFQTGAYKEKNKYGVRICPYFSKIRVVQDELLMLYFLKNKQ